MHDEFQNDKSICDVVFLCLRQLVCCIYYLEQVFKIEQDENKSSMVGKF